MLLISCTIFPREQKLPTPQRKSFSRRYLIGEAPGTQQGEENRQAVLGSAKRHKLWIPKGVLEVTWHVFLHVTSMCFTYPEVADFRGPLFLFPLPQPLAGVRSLAGGWQNQLESSSELSIWGAVGKELGVYFRWQTWSRPLFFSCDYNNISETGMLESYVSSYHCVGSLSYKPNNGRDGGVFRTWWVLSKGVWKIAGGGDGGWEWAGGGECRQKRQLRAKGLLHLSLFREQRRGGWKVFSP